MERERSRAPIGVAVLAVRASLADLLEAEPLQYRSDFTLRRHKHDAVALADGRVLITGGADERDDRGTYRSAEVFDPRANGGAGSFARTGDLQLARFKHAGTSVLLPDGSVVVAAGAAAPERYNPRTGRFTLIPSAPGTPPLRGSFSAAAALPGGTVLVTGGYGGGHGATAQAWTVGVPASRTRLGSRPGAGFAPLPAAAR